jgi:hypothetical protein
MSIVFHGSSIGMQLCSEGKRLVVRSNLMFLAAVQLFSFDEPANEMMAQFRAAFAWPC